MFTPTRLHHSLICKLTPRYFVQMSAVVHSETESVQTTVDARPHYQQQHHHHHQSDSGTVYSHQTQPRIQLSKLRSRKSVSACAILISAFIHLKLIVKCLVMQLHGLYYEWMYLECISSCVSYEFSGSIEYQWEISNSKNTIVSAIVLKCAAK